MKRYRLEGAELPQEKWNRPQLLREFEALNKDIKLLEMAGSRTITRNGEVVEAPPFARLAAPDEVSRADCLAVMAAHAPEKSEAEEHAEAREVNRREVFAARLLDAIANNAEVKGAIRAIARAVRDR